MCKTLQRLRRVFAVLNTRHLRQHFLPSQISEGVFFGNLQYLHSASPGSRSPGSSSSAHPQLQINLDSKKPREGAPCVRPCLKPKMDFKAAPTLLALAGRGGTAGGAAGSRSPPGSSCFIPPPIRSTSQHFPWKSIATEVSSRTLERRG